PAGRLVLAGIFFEYLDQEKGGGDGGSEAAPDGAAGNARGMGELAQGVKVLFLFMIALTDIARANPIFARPLPPHRGR
ncbi:MAG: hypothetical protein KDK11_05730, partial [Maritimibacter sp.]|nr:hypothetical protein [Maritimibacter sp.]